MIRKKAFLVLYTFNALGDKLEAQCYIDPAGGRIGGHDLALRVSTLDYGNGRLDSSLPSVKTNINLGIIVYNNYILQYV